MKYRQLALDNQLWLSLGSFPEADENDPSIVYQTHVIVNNEGNVSASYRKMHMFDAVISQGDSVDGPQLVKESSSFFKGASITEPCFSPVGYLGLSISYDVRFPELYRHLILKGA
jgi:predicted amidohydrolase